MAVTRIQMKTYGALYYDETSNKWVIPHALPHIAIRLKSLFPHIPKTKSAPFIFRNSPEMCADLIWFASRYTLLIIEDDYKRLEEGKLQNEKDINEAEAILLPEYEPVLPVLCNGYTARNYQVTGSDFAYLSRRTVIGDDVGLGKTITSILVLMKKGTLPAIVVVQSHLQLQWKAEIETVTNLKVHCINKMKPYNLPPAHVYIIKYTMLMGWTDIFKEKHFITGIFDECVAEDTVLNTPNGDVQIKNINIGDTVLSLNDEGVQVYDKVINKWNKGTKPVYEVITDSGAKINCTGNHVIITKNGEYTVDDIVMFMNNGLCVECYINDNQYIRYEDNQTIITRNITRRWKSFLSTLGKSKSKIQGKPFIETTGVCTDEIRNSKRIRRSSTKNRTELWLWKIFMPVYYKMRINFRRLLLSLLSWWKENCNEGVARSINTGRSGLLVYGRWWVNSYTNSHIDILVQQGRTRIDTDLFLGKMGYKDNNRNAQEKVLRNSHTGNRTKQILSIGSTLYDSIYGIQTNGYRITQKLCSLFKTIYNHLQSSYNLLRYLQKRKPKKGVAQQISYRPGFQGKGKKTSKITAIKEKANATVYDIETENTHKFFGNNILVHNCQELRHATTQKYQAAYNLSLNLDYVIGLSATVIVNYGDEAHTIFDLVEPGCLGERDEFEREWTTTGKVVVDPKALGTYLRDKRKFLRRTRSEVGRELPPVNKLIHQVDYDTNEEKKVEHIAKELAIKALTDKSYLARGQAGREMSILLRKVTGVAKAKSVAEYAKLFLENDEQILIGAWHRDVYAILMKELGKYNPVMFTGSESATQKKQSLENFISGKSKIMFVSLRAGAGINGLQNVCKTLLVAELDFSPAIIKQLLGRIQRDKTIGEQEQVTIAYLVSECGSDPAMMSILGLKSSQAAGINDPFGGGARQVTDESRIKILARMYLAKIGMDLSKIPEICPTNS